MKNSSLRNNYKLTSWCSQALIVTMFLFVTICSASDKDVAREVVSLSADKYAILDIKEARFVYNARQLPDPFHPFIDFSHIERAIPSDETRPLTPLEKYALNQFSLVGIILAGDKHNYALVEDPDQIGYTVKVGDKIGNQSGFVKEITNNKVIIEEPYLDIFDNKKVRTITLQIREIADISLAN